MDMVVALGEGAAGHFSCRGLLQAVEDKVVEGLQRSKIRDAAAGGGGRHRASSRRRRLSSGEHKRAMGAGGG
uniref:Uncharacterized protein n=1 Tax=Arundo donax TaxID=35708 RepID=A0A0A9G0W9_ARUDO